MCKLEKQFFGFTMEGDEIYKYILSNDDIILTVANLGATVLSLLVKDKDGQFVDVVLGYDTVYDYQRQTGYMGATVGRCANRIGGAAFVLNGEKIKLSHNEGANQLHGGKNGFDKKIWKVNDINNGIEMTLFSLNNEEGYPGNMEVKVTFTLENSTFAIEYHALSDADTICNLTNHSYFNLSGANATTLEGEELKLFAEKYTPTDGDNISLGTLENVKDTPLDFRCMHEILRDINSDFPQIKKGNGFDHNFAVEGYDGSLRPCAEAISHKTGIVMKQYTTLPGVQLYTANGLQTSVIGKNSVKYGAHSAFCLETQYFPNAINVPKFLNPLASENVMWKEKTVFEFSTVKD
ncbi:MAG: aldose epimerase family protein [Oscillospiraceae bacterium]